MLETPVRALVPEAEWQGHTCGKMKFGGVVLFGGLSIQKPLVWGPY